ncbi:MAG: hypothetical protein HOP20_06595 [Sulfuriferula sp.]|nr:hypothetical protein [Sulfuriferula sp.]
MCKSVTKLSFLIIALYSPFTWGVGKIESVTGTVSVMSNLGELRIPQENVIINQGDTIITGHDSTVMIATDDQGIIAIRPDTQLKINAYQANGNDHDTVKITLMRGGFRSVAGWISQTNVDGYQVNTPNATLTLLGSDNEPLVVLDGVAAGTYDRSLAGSAVMTSPQGKLTITSQQVAYVPSAISGGGANTLQPKLVGDAPRLFPLATFDRQIDEKKTLLANTIEASLKNKQQENLSKGNGINGKPKIGDISDQQEALGALNELVRSYETGNVNFIRNRLDTSMIGYQQFIDSVSQEVNQCKQMRVNLLNTQVQAGPDLAVVQTSWQKRCLALPNFTPSFTQGNSSFLMHKGKDGWYMAALSGSNLFAGSRTLATLTVGSSLTCSQIASSSFATLPFMITLVDPDLVGASTASVKLTTSQGENETVVLNAADGGVFTRSSYVFSGYSPTPNDNIAEVSPTALTPVFVCPSINITYTDTTTPSGYPQTVGQVVVLP